MLHHPNDNEYMFRYCKEKEQLYYLPLRTLANNDEEIELASTIFSPEAQQWSYADLESLTLPYSQE